MKTDPTRIYPHENIIGKTCPKCRALGNWSLVFKPENGDPEEERLHTECNRCGFWFSMRCADYEDLPMRDGEHERLVDSGYVGVDKDKAAKSLERMRKHLEEVS